jgi:ribosomal protein L10
MVRRALRSIIAEFPQLERLLPHVRGNIGFVFTSSDLPEIRELITANKVAAPARAGALAPKDVQVPAGNTGMEPGKTSFFQALGIPTKIARGTIEIVSDVQVVTAGTRVGQSEATLLNMLNISPFTYGMSVVQIYDQGNVFPPDVLDVSTDELIGRFLTGVQTVAALSLALNYPTLASVTHSLVNTYKNLLAIALVTEYTFEGAEKVVFRLFFYCSNVPEPCSRPKNISPIPKHSPLPPLLLQQPRRTPPPKLRRRRKRPRILMRIWSVSLCRVVTHLALTCVYNRASVCSIDRLLQLVLSLLTVPEIYCLSNDQKSDTVGLMFENRPRYAGLRS